MENNLVPPYEKFTVLTLPPKLNGSEDVLADFEKLDLLGNRLDSDYPIDDINYCEGKARMSHPFQKITRFYRVHKDAFLFHATLRDENMKAKIFNSILTRNSEDSKAVDDYRKKISVYLTRIEKGELEADIFLNDSELTGFFSGCHIDTSEHSRNIHENLYINVNKRKKSLITSSYFTRTTPLMTAEESELKRVKIFANGERVMSIFKDDEGMRNYIYTKQTDAKMELGWSALKSDGETVSCVIILKFNRGRVALQHLSVDGDEGKSSVASMAELAKQNTSVLVKARSLVDLLHALLNNRKKDSNEVITDKACVASIRMHQAQSRERMTILRVPKHVPNWEDEIFADFRKLNFSNESFSPSDEINYNDGVQENPFNKIAKLYCQHKDVFHFNYLLLDVQKRAKVIEIVEEKCKGLEDSFILMGQFKAQMNIYLDRICGGMNDAKGVISEDLNGYYYGCFIAKKGQPRNIHADLNVNLTKNGQCVETSSLLTKVTPRMEAEGSNVERIKIFGNGKRIMTVLKGHNKQRNYSISKLANMELNVDWLGRETRSGQGVTCSLTLEVKAGQIRMKGASIDGVIVKEAAMIGYALQNCEVLIRNQSLSKVLEESFYNSGRGTPCSIGSMKAKIQPAVAGTSSLSSCLFDCESTESLVVHTTQNLHIGKITNDPKLKEILEDFGKLELSQGPLNPNDQLNFNMGQKEDPFNKILKYYDQQKDVMLFLAVLLDDNMISKFMHIVEEKCGRNPRVLLDFVTNMRAYIDNAKAQATELLGGDDSRDFYAVCVGNPNFTHSQNHDNHNINLLYNINENGRCSLLNISDYFNRQPPGTGNLKSIKIYGNSQEIASVIIEGSGQRNYSYSKAAEIDLKIKWKAIEFGPSTSCCRQEKECMVVLKTGKGLVTISKATLDGKTIQAASILELAKQNDKVLLNNKSLFDILRFSCLNAVIKGATTLFFTAASTAGGGDATKLNNNCTDVFLMLMLQDQEEKERILDMVSKRSPRPDDTRREFLDRMDLFKQKFANGDYVAEDANQPRGSRNDTTGVVIRKAKRRLAATTSDVTVHKKADSEEIQIKNGAGSADINFQRNSIGEPCGEAAALNQNLVDEDGACGGEMNDASSDSDSEESESG